MKYNDLPSFRGRRSRDEYVPYWDIPVNLCHTANPVPKGKVNGLQINASYIHPCLFISRLNR